MLNYLLVALAASFAINVVMFLVAFCFKTDKLTDISYAVTFIALALWGLLVGPVDAVKIVLFTMIAVWAVRLGGFLLIRIWRTGKDARFDAIRGSFWKFGRFWLGQALSVWVILLAGLLVFYQPRTMFALPTVLGVCVWAAGLVVEAAADLQKFRFARNPANKNKWIATGVWRYSRHPNYFGEILVWVGVYLFALPILGGWQLAVAALSPLFIMTLLLFVSGIPVLEKSADARWGKLVAYKKYKQRTSVLVLFPPKR